MTEPASCRRCIMNREVDPLITFDSSGLCNHCLRYDALISSRVFRGQEGKDKLAALVATIKAAGKGRDYDCLIGVSGGVDSTYVAYLAKKLGLRPLAVHFDNGWNSELAVMNIERVLKKLDIDLMTYVIDWEEFRDLQMAFLKASTPDGEIPTDHAINALLWQQALKHRIKYIISGMNFATEALSVPHWAYGHSDWRYIRDVYRRFGTRKLKTYPHFGLPYLVYLNFLRGVRTVSILNYVDYNKQEVMQTIQDDLGWVYYGGKHYESIYTRFFQGYILPRKFGIDKRYGHLSDLINSGQLSREAALREIQQPPYPEELLVQDIDFVLKKFQIRQAEFDALMALPTRSFRDFKNQYNWIELLKKLVTTLRARGLYPK